MRVNKSGRSVPRGKRKRNNRRNDSPPTRIPHLQYLAHPMPGLRLRETTLALQPVQQSATVAVRRDAVQVSIVREQVHRHHHVLPPPPIVVVILSFVVVRSRRLRRPRRHRIVSVSPSISSVLRSPPTTPSPPSPSSLLLLANERPQVLHRRHLLDRVLREPRTVLPHELPAHLLYRHVYRRRYPMRVSSSSPGHPDRVLEPAQRRAPSDAPVYRPAQLGTQPVRAVVVGRGRRGRRRRGRRSQQPSGRHDPPPRLPDGVPLAADDDLDARPPPSRRRKRRRRRAAPPPASSVLADADDAVVVVVVVVAVVVLVPRDQDRRVREDLALGVLGVVEPPRVVRTAVPHRGGEVDPGEVGVGAAAHDGHGHAGEEPRPRRRRRTMQTPPPPSSARPPSHGSGSRRRRR